MARHDSTGLPDDLVGRYFHDIDALGDHPHGLSTEEEVELSLRIRGGDGGALRKLAQANLRFVISVARQYQNLGLPLCDLIGEGNQGLMEAARRFDGTKGFKFISYAVWWIRQRILQALAEQSRTVRLPMNRIDELTRINNFFSKLEQRLGREPTQEELATELEVHPEEMEFLAVLAQGTVSLDAPCDEIEPNRTFGDLLPDDSMPDVEVRVSFQEAREQVRRALETLTVRETRILSMYFGLDGQEPMTLEAIGAHVNLTRERIRQLKERALAKLRYPPCAPRREA